MKRMLIIAGLVMSAAVSGASAAATQEERGLLLVPMAGRVGPVTLEPCPGVISGTASWATGKPITVHEFPIDASTWEKPFALSSNERWSNIDIGFRTKTSWISFQTFSLGGEHGTVPAGATEAFVCLAAGPPTRFLYRAGLLPSGDFTDEQ